MDGRVCKKCGVWKPRAGFHAHKLCKGGINTVCKECRQPLSANNYKNSSLEYRLWYRAKRRAKVKNMEFDISITDIQIPELCPVFGVPMVVNTEYAASLDRIDSSKGYTKDNIQVISNKANILKNDATIAELKLFANWVNTL
jgi:PP-loop superfamily ATP-utilizing enzyme